VVLWPVPGWGFWGGELSLLFVWVPVVELCALLPLDMFAIDGGGCESATPEDWLEVEHATRSILGEYAVALRVTAFAKLAGTSAHLFSPHACHVLDLLSSLYRKLEICFLHKSSTVVLHQNQALAVGA
jgi:hypothetical protein